MSRGEATREAILEHALVLAARVGLAGLSIGQLAEETDMSKSGLFAHFGSKEGLQVALIGWASDRFVDEVVRPALKVQRGVPRLRAFFQGWLDWGLRGGKGAPHERKLSAKRREGAGCFFVSASAELDDQPGAARDAVVRAQRDWFDTLAGAVRIAVTEGHLAKETDPEQSAFALHGMMLSAHHADRLLGDPRARALAEKTFELWLRGAAP